MKNQLSENQLTQISELFVLAIKANSVEGYLIRLEFVGEFDIIAFSINLIDSFEFHEKLKISEALPIFEWIMKRWRNQLIDAITSLKPTE